MNKTKNISLFKSKKPSVLGVGSQEHVQLTGMFYLIGIFLSQQNLLSTLEIVSCHLSFQIHTLNVERYKNRDCRENCTSLYK